jgi:hypothetical protein
VLLLLGQSARLCTGVLRLPSLASLWKSKQTTFLERPTLGSSWASWFGGCQQVVVLSLRSLP